ncbi:MAG: GFA family protein [Salaquimonas sp.]
MSDSKEHRGNCRCGGIKIVARGEIVLSVYCHCDDCRRAVGAPILASVGFLKDNVDWLSDKSLKRHTIGTATRVFCSECGTPVAQEHESAADNIFFNTGFMDNPQDYPPTYHTFAGQQLAWLKLSDDLPRVEKTLLIKTD